MVRGAKNNRVYQLTVEQGPADKATSFIENWREIGSTFRISPNSALKGLIRLLRALYGP